MGLDGKIDVIVHPVERKGFAYDARNTWVFNEVCGSPMQASARFADDCWVIALHVPDGVVTVPDGTVQAIVGLRRRTRIAPFCGDGRAGFQLGDAYPEGGNAFGIPLAGLVLQFLRPVGSNEPDVEACGRAKLLVGKALDSRVYLEVDREVGKGFIAFVPREGDGCSIFPPGVVLYVQG